jgi:hypothetical protein
MFLMNYQRCIGRFGLNSIKKSDMLICFNSTHRIVDVIAITFNNYNTIIIIIKNKNYNHKIKQGSLYYYALISIIVLLLK